MGVKRSLITGILAIASTAIYLEYDAACRWNGQVIAASFPVFRSTCVGQPVPYHIPKHPIICFGDSITAGHGATIRCPPVELRFVSPESAHRVYTADTSYLNTVKENFLLPSPRFQLERFQQALQKIVNRRAIDLLGVPPCPPVVGHWE